MATFPWGFCLLQAVGPSDQRLAEIQLSYPHPLGQATPMCQPDPGLQPQGWELGTCHPPWACLPHHPVSPRHRDRGQACSARPHPGTEPRFAAASTSGTLIHLPVTPPHVPGRPALMCSVLEHRPTPEPLSFMPSSCPPQASMPAASPACTAPPDPPCPLYHFLTASFSFL